MKISGNVTMKAGREQAWAAFQDPGVLGRTIPGVQSLTETGENAYDLAVVAGVAAIKGSYTGKVALSQLEPMDAFVLKAQGAGAPGTIGADVAVRLSDGVAGGTDVAYEADVVVGGAIGGVGQRMLSGVGKKMAAGFFAAIDRDILTGGAVAASEAAAMAGAEAAGELVSAGASAGAGVGVGGPRGQVDYAPLRSSRLGPLAAMSQPNALVSVLAGAVAGATIALVGVAVGVAVGRRAGGR